VQALGFMAGLLIIFATRKSSPNLRNAAVCVAATLSTPYLLDYDMALAGFGAAFLYAEGVRSGFLSYEKSILAFIWIAPWFARPASLYLWLPLGAIAMTLLAAMIARRSGSSLFMGEVRRHGFADEGLEGRFINRGALRNVDGSPGPSSKTGVEQA